MNKHPLRSVLLGILSIFAVSCETADPVVKLPDCCAAGYTVKVVASGAEIEVASNGAINIEVGQTLRLMCYYNGVAQSSDKVFASITSSYRPDATYASCSVSGDCTYVSVTGNGDGVTKVQVQFDSQGAESNCLLRRTIRLQVVPATVPVDLGLSVQWAFANLGSTTAERPGARLAWGEVSTKEDGYTIGSYKYTLDWPSLKRYNATDGLKTLKAEDDAASYNLGMSWRMPTKADFEELKTLKVEFLTGVYGYCGYSFTNTASGKAIFLPICEGDLLTGRTADYWTCEVDDAEKAATLHLSSDGVSLGAAYRYLGHFVRPVKPKQKIQPADPLL